MIIGQLNKDVNTILKCIRLNQEIFWQTTSAFSILHCQLKLFNYSMFTLSFQWCSNNSSSSNKVICFHLMNTEHDNWFLLQLQNSYLPVLFWLQCQITSMIYQNPFQQSHLCISWMLWLTQAGPKHKYKQHHWNTTWILNAKHFENAEYLWRQLTIAVHFDAINIDKSQF